MSIEEIRNELDELNRRILGYSVDKGLSLVELEDMLVVLNELKERFLEISFIYKDLWLLEEVRFAILENICDVRIFIKEKTGMDALKELERLQKLEIKGGKVNE